MFSKVQLPISSDWQMGKRDGDGTQGIVKRINQTIPDVTAQIKELRKIASLLCFSKQKRASASPQNLSPSSTVTPADTITPAQALWTAMSTTIGIGNIFGPIVAIAFGGPGAVLAYFFASLFGAVLTYSEVFLALSSRRLTASGKIEGGPMCYIESALGKSASIAYGCACAALLAAWSMSQSHTISHMLVSY